MDFIKAAFWVQIHKVPLLCMTKKIGEFLGNMIGEVREIDTGPSGDCVGKFIRVRVVINVNQPLRSLLRVDVLLDGRKLICFYAMRSSQNIVLDADGWIMWLETARWRQRPVVLKITT
ncbi:hypothetical protein Ddye_027191 [Dipteronia dyeriana]|uniref:DUF4283 domain-containing protein n=1 Tax=Dipteronia dyeriana TaxID=168575 RepID=A0AAD9TPA5_9ROSI|nr:hypothetical protein Ddye_027191 [Dipteronia dyeriana]